MTSTPIVNAGIEWSEGSFKNSRGSTIYTQQWVRQDAKGIIVVCHGYGDHCHWLVKEVAIKFANAGLSSFVFDQEGHGKSDGLKAYVPNFDLLVEDTIFYIEQAKRLHPNLKCFVYGSSMGGAIALLVGLKRPDLVSGLCLMSPMIKIVESSKPHYLVVQALKALAYVFPTWAAVPSVDVIDIAFRDPEQRVLARSHPLGYSGRLRLGTGLAILQITDYLQANLANVTSPLFVAHGTGDLVTSHETSEELFYAAQSTDKTLRLYEGMWHVLPMEPNCKLLEGDLMNWIFSRIESTHTCAIKELVPDTPNTVAMESTPVIPTVAPVAV